MAAFPSPQDAKEKIDARLSSEMNFVLSAYYDLMLLLAAVTARPALPPML